MILLLEVCLHEIHVGCQVFKEGACKGSAQHRDTHLRIGLSKRIHHGHSHGHIAKRRESDNEQMVFFHVLILVILFPSLGSYSLFL